MPRPVFDRTTGWWSIRVCMPDGKRRKFSLARDPRWKPGGRAPSRPPPEVERVARKYIDIDINIKHGVDVAGVRPLDLAAFLTDYRARHAAEHRPNSARGVAQAVRSFLGYCGGKGVVTAQAVTAAVCADYLRHRRKAGAARGTVRTEKACLAPAWAQAVRDGVLAANPWAAAPVPGKPDAAEPAYWTFEELDRLVAAAAGWVKDLILVAVNTGGRIDSLLNLKWEHVHFDRGAVRLKSKTGVYEVPMSAGAREVLTRRRAALPGPGLVFPGLTPGKPRVPATSYAAIKAAVGRAGLPAKGSFNHCLRHTFASHAVMKGIPLVTVSRWLGHKSIHQTMRYSHLAESESHRQMEGFAPGGGATGKPPAGSGPTPPPPGG